MLLSFIFLHILHLTLLPALAAKTQVTYPNVIACLKANGGAVLTSESPEWEATTKPYNLRIAPVPAAVVTPQNANGVKNILACARQFPGTRLSPLCGGMSFVSFGLGGVDGAIVVNMKMFKQMKLLRPKDGVKIVKVGGGVVVRELTLFLLKNGGLYWPHARGLEVGVVGSAIGGGFGPPSRMVGTTMDNVVAVEIMLPEGSVTRATADSNPDVFFAALGAGSSFGIILSLEIKARKVYANPVFYLYQFNKPTLDQAVASFTAFQDYGINRAPPELSVRLRMGLPGNLILQGFYYGPLAQFNTTIQPLLEGMPTPSIANFTAMTFIETEEWSGGPLDGPPATRATTVTYTNSLVTFEPLSTDTIRTFLSNLINRSEEKKSEGFMLQPFADLWGGYGSYSSNMAKSDKNKYGFPHNHALLLIRADGVLLNSSSAQAWPSDGIEFVQAFTKPLFDSQKAPRSYLNYRDSDYSEAEWSTRYHSCAYPRLQQLKQKLDRQGIMSANPQSIKV